MDVRGILQGEARELLDEELGMLEEELAIGDYDEAYRKECGLLIDQERHARKVARVRAGSLADAQETGERVAGDEGRTIPHVAMPAVQRAFDGLSPFNEVQQTRKTPQEIVAADLSVMRRSQKHKTLFRDYLASQQIIDEAFLDEHLSLFDEWELAAVLDDRQLSEAFLEKYFDSLDPDKVATTQVFSEEFFMRHFSKLDARLVLQKGKNAWRDKGARSRKLDTFLRLKGVRL